MKKIKNFFLKIDENYDLVCLIAIFLTSLAAFLCASAKPIQFTIAGAICAICAMLFVSRNAYKHKPAPKLFTVLGLIIVIMGFISMAKVGKHIDADLYTPEDKFWCTYLGAWFGMLAGAFLGNELFKDRN